jgi:hypothetical protein
MMRASTPGADGIDSPIDSSSTRGFPEHQAYCNTRVVVPKKKKKLVHKTHSLFDKLGDLGNAVSNKKKSRGNAPGRTRRRSVKDRIGGAVKSAKMPFKSRPRKQQPIELANMARI